MNKIPQWRSLLVGLGMFLALWQLLAWIIHNPIMPSPLLVLPAFARRMFGALGLHFLASAGRVLASIALATLLAAPIGLGLGQVPALDRAFSPLIAITYPIPKIVLLPAIYVLFGISDFSKIFLIALILFFQILVVVRDEAAGLRPELLLSVRSLGAGRMALLRYVYLPASLPAILTALRLSAGTAVAVLFIAEQSLTRYGLGYFIVVQSYQTLRYVDMYAGILAMAILGLLLYFAIDFLEALLAPHLRVQREEQG